MKYLLIAVLCLSIALISADEAEDIKKFHALEKESIGIINMIEKLFEGGYVKEFASHLKKGVEDLAKHTEDVLAKSTDNTIRHDALQYAIKAFERLIKFITELSSKEFK